ncbi:MAG: aminotransferase [Novosphingobium sp.]|jgi:4-aminobutyrate--pyruvate transaminase|nr:aminotransferase [Novosphingobium sp.]
MPEDISFDVDRLREGDIGALLHPFTNAVAHAQSGPDIMVKAEGCRVYDHAGVSYIDGMSGMWSVGLGYSEERLIEAAVRQLKTLPFFHIFSHKSHPAAIELAEKLLSMLPFPMSKVFFVNSGSEAVDSAIKLSWYHWAERGEPQRRKIISRQRAYHGANIGSASATGLPGMHGGFGHPAADFIHVSCPHYWRNALPDESQRAFSARLANEIEETILREGPDTVAAFIAEPVMGAGGVVLPPEGYFDAVQHVLRRYGIILIADEVICGFGRTGAMFGSETVGMQPDIMTFAKQMSSSYMPIGAVAISEAIYEPVKAASGKRGALGLGYTNSGHPVAAAVALEALKIYEERDVVAQVRRTGPHFLANLRRLEAHPLVGEVRGVGLIAAVELVADKATKKQFDPIGKVAAFVMRRAYENGLIVRALPQSDALSFCPPLFCTEAELNEIVDKFDCALKDAVEFAASLSS